MVENMLDDFRDVSSWLPVASGLAELNLRSEHGPNGAAMCLDFDFKGGGGFVVARKQVSIPLPETYAFVFEIRGAAPKNKLEFKLSDSSGKNVWWFHRDAFEVPGEWQRMEIRSSEIEFAWGPAGGGRMGEVGAIEIAIAAGPGGKGTVSIANLRLEDRTVYATPVVKASSEARGHAAANVLDGSGGTSWRSDGTGTPQWMIIDFQATREYGGLIITWEPAGRARAFEIAISNDAVAWKVVHASDQAEATTTYVYLPATTSRFLRIDLRRSASGFFGIVAIEIQPFEFSRSIDAFFRYVATKEPRGAYPKYLYAEQTYWSPVGIADGNTCGLLNEEGMIEVDKGTFSIEPFLLDQGELVSWADVSISQELEKRYLPVPSSIWVKGDLELRTTAFASRTSEKPVLYVRYRVRNGGSESRTLRLFAALRPFQVTPPWQAFEGMGGISRINALEFENRVARVNGARIVVSLTQPGEFAAAAFDQGGIVDHLRRGVLPARPSVTDAFGFASGAFGYRLDVAVGSFADVWLAIPFGADSMSADEAMRALGGPENGATALRDTLSAWEGKLNAFELRVPTVARDHVDTMRTAIAHVLINRDGPALQPGPRRYTRAWIRDGAIMAAALLRMGCVEEAKQFTRWYAGYQAADGNVPCAVDHKGPDWLVEHDSHGQLIFAVAECYRFTGDRPFLAELWPAVLKAIDYIESLRASRLGPEYGTGEKRARCGLLPESASHEGYLAHPVHAYWDDFWALRALRDAATMALHLQDERTAYRAGALADALQSSIYASIDCVIAERAIDYVPGSVEWADFDPTATSNAISLLDELRNLPRRPLERTFETYLTGFRRRCRNEIDWANYTPYEIRITGALVQLGHRAEANELLDFLLSDRRPLRWNQWPEIAWRDPKSPGHIGDVPHTWIGAEYALAFRSMLAFERVAENELVLAAGIPPAWLDAADGIEVRGMPTYYGTLSYALRRADNALKLTLSLSDGYSLERPRIVVIPPLSAPLTYVELNGKSIDTFTASECTTTEWPCDVLLRC